MDQRTAHQYLGARLRLVRQRRGLNLAWVARQLHLHPSTLSRLENGIQRLDVVTASRLARIYQVGILELLGDL